MSEPKTTIRRRAAALAREWGLTPVLFKLRIVLSPLHPGVLLRNLRWLAGPREPLPLPSVRARYLVCGSADIGGFLELGKLGARCVEDAARRHGREPQALGALLDFGCGSGRVLRNWAHLEGVDVHGTEMNPYLADECRRCVPFATVDLNRPEPPLPYADGEFGLVYAFSVFTHLHEDLQKAWRDELQRILAPNGLLLMTTHGEFYLPRLSEEERRRFEQGECIVHGAEFLGENLCITYHPETFVRELFEESFEVLEFAPEGAEGNPRQDLYVLRAKQRGASARGDQNG